MLDISRIQFKAGDMAQIDLDRLELQRVQYESEVQTAEINLRTAKIELLMLLDDRTPGGAIRCETGYSIIPNRFSRSTNFRQIALDEPAGPEGRDAIHQRGEDQLPACCFQWLDRSDVERWYSLNPSFNNPNDRDTVGVGVSIPLRIFDRNQGEKLRTKLDIDRNSSLRLPPKRKSSATWTPPMLSGTAL